jgi:hypothetical protein
MSLQLGFLGSRVLARGEHGSAYAHHYYALEETQPLGLRVANPQSSHKHELVYTRRFRAGRTGLTVLNDITRE